MACRRTTLVAALTTPLLVGAPGCAPGEVVVEANFPTEAAFMQSAQGRLRVFALTREQTGICPQLLDDLQASRFALEPVYDTERQDGCFFYRGHALPEFVGLHAYLLEMRSAANAVILQGCAIGEVYPGAPRIRIELQPTDDYDPSLVPAGTPASRCGGGP